ncbi:ribosome small subunit-dependent GTPase A [Desulfurispora thermophila]|uniref:ribosome small subunit-dependent GTPase A n=1 Tax=Desulfurispora thermophila TaxID=265470 RepID=UPI00035FB483
MLKATAGFYYVHDGEKVWECSLRGKFRLTKTTVLVGDRVVLQPRPEGTGLIVDVLPRNNSLIRPPVANVDLAVIVMACRNPDPSLLLLDRILIQVAVAGVEPLICFNKSDLMEPGGFAPARIYREAGYRVFFTSAIKMHGIEELAAALSGHIAVLAGPSGAGKSSLLNSLAPGLKLKVGEVSSRLQRGRHTTRHVELLGLPAGGWVADTPGFSALMLPALKKSELASFFPELNRHSEYCRFRGCLHVQEPDCSVRQAVQAGEVSELRYRHYLQFLQEITEQERKY